MNIINLKMEELKMKEMNIKEIENMIMNKTIFMLDMSKAHDEYRKVIRMAESSIKYYMKTANMKELLAKYNEDVEYTIKLEINSDGINSLVVIDEDGNRMFEPDWGRISGLLSRELDGLDGHGWD